MLLAKHVSGTPLSPAERQQRRDAARARWATLGAGLVGGGGIGAAVGVNRQARGGHRAMLDAVEAADQAELAHHALREATTRNWFKSHVQQVGTVKTVPRVYNYEIARLKRHLLRVGPGQKAGALKAQITRLEQLAGKAPVPVARQGTMRFANKGARDAHLALLRAQSDAAMQRGDINESVRLDLEHEQIANDMPELQPVAAHPVRAFRPGGENQTQVGRRITRVKSELSQRLRVNLSRLAERTAELRVQTRQATIDATEMLLHARLKRAGIKGAAIGAAIGLTTAGIALIARHVVTTESKPKLKKMRDSVLANVSILRKATQGSPENNMGAGMAESFRDWIDRLLGRSQQPLNIGDSLARALVPGITQAFANGATQPPHPAPDGSGGDGQYHINVDFDQLNPSVRRHMAAYTLDRIVQISNDQREAIRKILMDQSVLQGIGPREVARSLRESIGLTPHQTGIVRGYRNELESLNPAALERKLRDARYDPTIKRAIATGTPLSAEQIDAMVAAYHRRMLALRAETIARTESIRATSYGAVARAQDVMDQYPGFDVIKQWISTEDERTRPTHRDLQGKEVTGMETHFRTSAGNLIRWPIDDTAAADECINCRCAISFRFIPKAAAAASNLMATAV